MMPARDVNQGTRLRVQVLYRQCGQICYVTVRAGRIKARCLGCIRGCLPHTQGGLPAPGTSGTHPVCRRKQYRLYTFRNGHRRVAYVQQGANHMVGFAAGSGRQRRQKIYRLRPWPCQQKGMAHICGHFLFVTGADGIRPPDLVTWRQGAVKYNLTVLGIESSCDETAAAVVSGQASGPGTVVSSIIWGQEQLHSGFGGVVPEIAARAHAERLDTCVGQALDKAGMTLSCIDAIAVTAGPGLIGGVLSGIMCAKGLAFGSGKPIVAVNHLAGHALTPRMTDGLKYPYLMLLVSGGHCQFLSVLGPDTFKRLGGTIDDAPGEAFDKTAKLLGLGYPGGPAVEAAAAGGDPVRFHFPRPLLDRPDTDMSFSGLKTALRRARDTLVSEKGGLAASDQADLCASFQAAVADTLAVKAWRACALFVQQTGFSSPAIAVAGGVAANARIRHALQTVADDAGFSYVAPPLKYCTDNAAIIAWAGLEQYAAGYQSDLGLPARPRWPLDSTARPMLGSGKRGAKA